MLNVVSGKRFNSRSANNQNHHLTEALTFSQLQKQPQEKYQTVLVHQSYMPHSIHVHSNDLMHDDADTRLEEKSEGAMRDKCGCDLARKPHG